MGTTAEQIIQSPTGDALAEQQRDLEANSRFANAQRVRHAGTAQKHAATLAGENAAPRYRKLVLCCQLVTDAEFRVLCLIVEKGDADLSNSFASVAWLQNNLGGGEHERRKLCRVYRIIASLKAKGFLRRHRRGWQLCLPANVLGPDADAWHGPTNWTKRTPKGTY